MVASIFGGLKVFLVLAVLLLGFGAPPARAESTLERTGDTLQIALPLAAGLCSLGRRAFADFAARLLALEAMVHIPKNTLGQAPINLRPSGAERGFPSGHTAAAFYGAAALARSCLRASGPGQLVVWGAALVTGGSRIEAGAHFLFQVVFGALIGVLADRALRRRPAHYVAALRRQARLVALMVRRWLGPGPVRRIAARLAAAARRS